MFAYLSPLIVAVRHSGFIFLTLLVAYWIHTHQLKNYQQKSSEFIFSFIIAQLCISSIVMYIHDYKYSFSEGKNASTFIEKFNAQNNLPIVCQNTAMPVISAYTQKKVIEINSLKYSSFCHWNNNPFLLNEYQKIVQLKKYFNSSIVQKIIFISSEKINNPIIYNRNELKLILLKAFDKGIVGPESYFIYEVGRQ